MNDWLQQKLDEFDLIEVEPKTETVKGKALAELMQDTLRLVMPSIKPFLRQALAEAIVKGAEAVVVEKEKKDFRFQNIPQENEADHAYVDGWNAARDEMLKKLDDLKGKI